MLSLAVASLPSEETKVYLGGGASPNPQVAVLNGSTHDMVTVGRGAGVSVDRVTGRYWAAGLYDGDVLVRDGRSNTMLASVRTGYCPCYTAVDPVRRRVWVAAQCGNGNDPVWAIDADSYQIVAGPIGSGGVMGSLVVNPVMGRVYIGSGDASKRIDPSDNRLVRAGFGVVLGANSVTGRLYAVSGNELEIIDGTARPAMQLNTVPLPFRPGFVGIDTRSNVIYVGSSNRSSVEMMDATTGTLVGTVPLSPGFSPWLMATDTRSSTLYVVGSTSEGPTVLILQRR